RDVTLTYRCILGSQRHHRVLHSFPTRRSSDLVAMIERAGYQVAYFSSKEVRIGRVLDRACDIVAVAGGDGTIRKVAVKARPDGPDRKSTRLNSSHLVISYAVFCLKKKKQKQPQ